MRWVRDLINDDTLPGAQLERAFPEGLFRTYVFGVRDVEGGKIHLEVIGAWRRYPGGWIELSRDRRIVRLPLRLPVQPREDGTLSLKGGLGEIIIIPDGHPKLLKIGQPDNTPRR